MREVLYHFENPVSGIKGFTQMKPGWKQLSENIIASKPLSQSDNYISEAVLSWYEEEADMALLLSRKLGVLVKVNSKNKDSIKNDIKRVVKDNKLSSTFSIKNAVSDLKVTADFKSRLVSMSVRIIPPQDKGIVAKITWLNKQLEFCKKKSIESFRSLEKDIWIEADIKYVQKHIILNFSELNKLSDDAKGKDIQAYNIVLNSSFGSNFTSAKKFIELIEKMIITYYETFVQYLWSWTAPAPKIAEE